MLKSHVADPDPKESELIYRILILVCVENLVSEG